MIYLRKVNFNVPESKFIRSFPPVSGFDTIANIRPRHSIEELLERFKKFDREREIDKLRVDKKDAIVEQYSYNSITVDVPFELFSSPEKTLLKKYIFIFFPEYLNLSVDGCHGYGNSFADDAIIKVHEVKRIDTELIAGLTVSYSENGKPILLQQATRGCTTACTAMLLLESGKKIDPFKLKSRNLGDHETMKQEIREAGLRPLSGSCDSLGELEQKIKENGSAIVFVNSGIGGHVVVVDKVQNGCVTIRDPYHGWEVDIKKEYFEEAIGDSIGYIQILKSVK